MTRAIVVDPRDLGSLRLGGLGLGTAAGGRGRGGWLSACLESLPGLNLESHATMSTQPTPDPASQPQSASQTPAPAGSTTPAPAAASPAPAPPVAPARPLDPLDKLSQQDLRIKLDATRRELRQYIDRKKKIDRDLVSPTHLPRTLGQLQPRTVLTETD